MGEYIIVMHPVAPVREHLVFTLAKAGWLVTAPEVAGALERQAQRNGPPVVLIRDGGADDPTLANAIDNPQKGGAPRVLAVLTEEHGPLDRLAHQQLAHADDFLLWPADDAEILLRVGRLAEARAASVHATRSPHQDGARPTRFAGRAAADPRSYRLSGIEREIMRRLEAAHGAVVPIATLANSIAAESPERQMNTLRVHISRLRKKLEQDPRQPSHIVTVRGVGYRLGQ